MMVEDFILTIRVIYLEGDAPSSTRDQVTRHATFTLIMNILGASQVQRTVGLDSVPNAVLVVFGQYCFSLKVIISIIT